MIDESSSAEEKESVTQFIRRTERRTQRIFIGSLVSLSIIALCTTVALVWVGTVVQTNQNLAEKANTRTEQLKFESDLAREKVCAENENQTENCRALFRRLTKALSRRQRATLACAVLEQLHGEAVRNLDEQNPQCARLRP